MSAVTGLGLIETRLLHSYKAVGALPANPYLKNARVLEALDSNHQIAPLIGFRVLCDLARPYVSNLVVVDFNGNYGSPDFSESSPKYTESRLSPLGEVALQAEVGERPAVPIGLINGTTFLDGTMPPFAPERVVAALLAANAGASDSELIETVGLPHFATGCEVTADLESLASGEPTELRLEALIENQGDRTLHISRLPPRSSPSEIAETIDRLVSSKRSSGDWPIADLNDESHSGQILLVVQLTPEADRDSVALKLTNVWGVHRTIKIKLGISIPALLRGWVSDHGTSDLAGQLAPILTAAGH